MLEVLLRRRKVADKGIKRKKGRGTTSDGRERSIQVLCPGIRGDGKSKEKV